MNLTRMDFRSADWIAAGMAIVLVFLFHAALRIWIVPGSLFMDPDEFMRANRVLEILASGNWFDARFPRINPPDGFVSHWTRATDLLLLLGMLPLLPFMEPRAALETWAAAYPPVLHALTVLALIWGVRPLVRPGMGIYVVALALLQVSMFAHFRTGRIDHNALFLLCFALVFGLVLRVACARSSSRYAVVTGVVGAIAVWASVESIVFVFAGIAILALLWIFEGRAMLRPNLTVAASLFLGVAVCGVLERGLTDLVGSIGEIDRLSAFYVALFAANLTFWMVTYLADRLGATGHIASRMTLAVFGVVTAVAVVWMFQPQLLQGKVNQPDPEYARLRVRHILELGTALSYKKTSLEALREGLPHVAPLLAALPLLFWKLIRGGRNERVFSAYVLILTALYSRSGTVPIKYLVYFGLIGTLGGAYLMSVIEKRLTAFDAEMPLERRRVLALCAGLAFLILGPMLQVPKKAEEKSTAVSTPACVTSEGVRALAAATPGEARVVMTYADLAPELLYETRHSVLSIPNHRHQPGFLRTVRTMRAATDEEARRLVAESGAEILVLCKSTPLIDFFALERGSKTFGSRIYQGEIPSWLQVLPLAEPAETLGFRAFRVAPGTH